MIFLLLFTMFATGAEFGPSLEGEVVLAEAEADLADTGVAGCADQYLDDGVQLPDLPLFFRRNTPDAEWGTGEMIEVIVSASRHMRWLMPESSPINIGDISRERGGFLSGHLSHRGGVDADVGIYATGAMQDPRGGFQSLGSNFDVVANWALVSALLDTGAVEFILLDRAHITRLRTYTTQAGLLTEAEAEEVFPTDAHSWTLTGYVRHAPSHDNHLHVRVLCSDGSHSGR
ncbi:MAG: hypothetical protein EXR69_08135 [Myxococcales bacterium]|nr:hypothetical protein [Myxococcales bacterium]